MYKYEIIDRLKLNTVQTKQSIDIRTNDIIKLIYHIDNIEYKINGRIVDIKCYLDDNNKSNGTVFIKVKDMDDFLQDLLYLRPDQIKQIQVIKSGGFVNPMATELIIDIEYTKITIFKNNEIKLLDYIYGEIKNQSNGDGKSAYQIAVSKGFIGTEQEWLDSLKGADGTKLEDIDEFIMEKIDEKDITSVIDVTLSSSDPKDVKQELKEYINTKISEISEGDGSNTFNKKILFIGDSICQGVGTGDSSDGGKEKPYSYWIGLWNPLSTIYNEGIGGYTISKVNGKTNTICDRIENGDFENYDVDYVVIQGGINDTSNGVKCGYIRHGFNADLDVYTYAGALEYIFKYFTQKIQPCKVFFMSTYLVSQGYDYFKQSAYYNMAAELCSKIGVQYIDCFGMIPIAQLSGIYAPSLHANFRIHRDYIAPLIDNALKYGISHGSKTRYYSNPNVPMQVYFHSGKKKFDVGESFSKTDWRFNCVTISGLYNTVTPDVIVDSSEVNMLQNGTYNVYFTYTSWGVTVSNSVEITVAGVEDIVLESINVTKSKTEYALNDELSINDIIVTAIYNDDSTTIVTDISQIDYTGVDMNNTGSYIINVSYTEGTITKTNTVQISVVDESIPLILESIRATKITTTYPVNGSIDVGDITVTAIYSNGSTDIVTGWTSNVENIDTNSEGIKDLIITYIDGENVKTHTIQITISSETSNILDTGTIPGSDVNKTSIGTWTYYDNGELILEKDETSNQMGNWPASTYSWNKYATNVTKISIPSGFSYIGGSAFHTFSELLEVELNGTINIGSSAFEKCKKLNIIDLTKVTNINTYAFRECIALPSELVFGATTIQNNSLYNMPQIISIRWTDTPTTISASSLKSVTGYNISTNLKDIYVPWSEGDIADAPWGAVSATIHYDTK